VACGQSVDDAAGDVMLEIRSRAGFGDIFGSSEDGCGDEAEEKGRVHDFGGGGDV
jgi:hypothetical protein